MHSACLVVGPDPEALLEPFSEHLEVPRYKAYLDAENVQAMASHFSVPAADIAALAGKLKEWTGDDGGVDDGRLFQWSTENPHSKFDWYEIGGRFDGLLRLKTPRQPTGWRRWFGGTPTTTANQAAKRDVDAEPVSRRAPSARFRRPSRSCPA